MIAPRKGCDMPANCGRADRGLRRDEIPFEVCEAPWLPLVVQLRNLDEAIVSLDRIIAKLAQRDGNGPPTDEHSRFWPDHRSRRWRRLFRIRPVSPGSGRREFAAFLGLTPNQNSSGGKQKLGRISKMGNRNLRKLLVVGAHAVLFLRKPHTDPLRMWAKRLIEKKPFKLVAVALGLTRWRASPSQSCAARRSIGKFRRKERR